MKTKTDKKVKKINLSFKEYDCPRCQKTATRHSVGKRCVQDIGEDSPLMLEIVYSKHYCTQCRKHFSVPMDKTAKKSGRFSNGVVEIATNLVKIDGKTLKKASEIMKEKYNVNVRPTTLHDWVVG